jgi:alanine racemase
MNVAKNSPKTRNKSQFHYRTWIEIDSRAARRNYEIFRKLVGPKVKIWSVVKSNAYGHGLMAFSKVAAEAGVDGFCVDSVVEGLRLRREGIKKPILVLGPTLSALFEEAAKDKITITISNFEALKALARQNFASQNLGGRASFVAKKATKGKNPQRFQPPEFHLKIDTGMHRQGFYVSELPKVIRFLSQKLNVKCQKSFVGIYTHFASAKDINYPTYTEEQFKKFMTAVKLFEQAGFKNLVKHAAATGGTLINPKYHLDAVRIGIGLYGLWPSRELEMQLASRIHLEPVLSWRAVVSETKKLKSGDYIGYDLVERVPRDTKMAILPIGYWHGFPRSLSQVGEVLIGGRRAKVLGRVSMDLLAVDVGGIKCKPGDSAVIIGKDGKEELMASEVAGKSGTTHYEFLTRLNPLMEKVLV